MNRWKKIPNSLPNLQVLIIGEREIGFIEKPHDTRGDKNAWRCFLGIGDSAKFLGHRWTETAAKAVVESSYGN